MALFEIISGKKYYAMLKRMIVENELLDKEPNEIKRYILEKCGILYSNKEIVKLLERLEK